MDPHNVISPLKRLQRVEVLYTDDEDNFSIASVLWDRKPRIAIRWNGPCDKLGYPTSSGHPTWFIIPRKVALAFAESIGNAELTNIIKASSSEQL